MDDGIISFDRHPDASRGPAREQNQLRVGIDIGGTFTDFVIYDPQSNQLDTFKLLSTPENPADVVLRGLELIRSRYEPENQSIRLDIIHGSTVATNALLERKGARTAFVTTLGFADLLQIGRQNRPELYDLFAYPPQQLIPVEYRYEVNERVDSLGQVLKGLEAGEIESLVSELKMQGVQSVAICLLFSFLHPEHESLIAKRLREAGFPVSVSSEILPEFREYERASTTTVNAYVSPALDSYLSRLEADTVDKRQAFNIRVMQSNGGNIRLDEARRAGVHCILSGPAGGVVAGQYLASRVRAPELAAMPGNLPSQWLAGYEPGKVITFDMGGTSTDVSLIDGTPQTTTEAEIGGCPIRIPILDIHTIGSGGGSIARADAGGALRVGPQSAGADPGPACYGSGDLPTVTDANLVLGRLSPAHFLGGQIILDRQRAWQALDRLGAELGLSAVQAAAGVVAVANAHMERALRVISVERGHDPRRFALVSFGGAGGLHAVDLARRVGITSVLVPPLAATFSAFGMLAAQVVKDYSQTTMMPGSTPLDEIEVRLDGLTRRGIEELQQSGIHRQKLEQLVIERFVDMRYLGQSYELTVPYSSELVKEFHAAHQRQYGYARLQADIEFVTLRTRVIQRVQPPQLAPLPFAGEDPSPALLEERLVVLGEHGEAQPVPFYRGEDLRPGNQVAGPALVVRPDTTILIGAGDRGIVDRYGNLWIGVGQ
jgi:N-methylhydantoinase A